MPKQQSLKNRAISIVVLRGRTTSIEHLAALVPKVLAALQQAPPGQVIHVEGR